MIIVRCGGSADVDSRKPSPNSSRARRRGPKRPYRSAAPVLDDTIKSELYELTLDELKTYAEGVIDLYPGLEGTGFYDLQPELLTCVRAAEAAIERARGDLIILDFVACLLYAEEKIRPAYVDRIEDLEIPTEDPDPNWKQRLFDAIDRLINQYLEGLSNGDPRDKVKIENVLRAYTHLPTSGLSEGKKASAE